MDVKTTISIYMEQPEGFVVFREKHKVCKLVTSLYGLKKAPKQWHAKFDSTIISYGLVVNNYDRCVYSKLVDDKCVIVCLYVDDLLIFASKLDVANYVKNFLSSKLDMKGLTRANVILGAKLTRSIYSITLFQSHYIDKVL